jgi:hypothetical protein
MDFKGNGFRKNEKKQEKQIAFCKLSKNVFPRCHPETRVQSF